MKKIIVVGSGGAGKSTFARRLGEKLALPVVHLDKLFWHPNWTRTPNDEWLEVVRREIERDEWVMDGNFGATREMRMKASDTIILLDMPRWLCIYRILKRTLLFHRETRPDMAEGCKERFDLEFILWVWNYPNRSKKRVEAELARFRDKRIVILRSASEVDDFLDGVHS